MKKPLWSQNRDEPILYLGTCLGTVGMALPKHKIKISLIFWGEVIIYYYVSSMIPLKKYQRIKLLPDLNI